MYLLPPSPAPETTAVVTSPILVKRGPHSAFHLRVSDCTCTPCLDTPQHIVAPCFLGCLERVPFCSVPCSSLKHLHILPQKLHCWRRGMRMYADVCWVRSMHPDASWCIQMHSGSHSDSVGKKTLASNWVQTPGNYLIFSSLRKTPESLTHCITQQKFTVYFSPF